MKGHLVVATNTVHCNGADGWMTGGHVLVAVDVTRIGGTGGWIAGGSDEDLCLLPLSCPIAWDFQARAFEWALCILLPKKVD